MACHRVAAAVFVIWLLIPCGLPQGSSLVLTKRIEDEKLYRIVCKIVPILLPVSIDLRKIPVLGRYLSYAVPVANYKGVLPIKDEDLQDWAILDTYDWLSPKYDNPQTTTTVKNWFIEVGLTNIQVTSHGVIVGKGKKY